MYMSKIRSIIAYGCAAWFHCRRDCTKDGGKCTFPQKKRKGEEVSEGKCPGCGQGRDDEHVWSIKPRQVTRLHRIHYNALLKLSGAMQDNPGPCLQKALFTEPIEVSLDRIVLTFHAKNYDQESMQVLREVRQPYGEFKRHPYTTLDGKAEDIRRRRDKAIEAAEAAKAAKAAKPRKPPRGKSPK